MVLEIVAIMLGIWLLWKVLSLGLRLIGWGLIAVGAFYAESAAEVLGTVVTIGTGVVALTLGHVVFRIRKGFWRPRLLRGRYHHRTANPYGYAYNHRQPLVRQPQS